MITIKDLYVKPKISKQAAAREALAAIERVYLRATGFKDIGNDEWTPPRHLGPMGSRKYRHYVYRTGHAINAVKFWDAR